MIEMIHIDVVFTDKSSKTFSIELRTIVNDFKEIVAQSIDLKDEIYFGFYFKDDQESNYWLCDKKSIISHEYFKGIISNLVLYFAIKYFYEIQNVLSDDVVKYYMYHQLKYDIYSGNIECDSDTCFKLLAMSLFIDGLEFENFREDTKKMSIIPLHLFMKHPSVEHCIWKIEQKYNEFINEKNNENLMDEFVALIYQLPSQISHFFLSKDFNSSHVVIGINKIGFIECNQNTKSSFKLSYQWIEISNITSNKSRVNLDLQDPSYRSSLRRKSCANTISYDLFNSNLAKSFVYLAKDIIDFISIYNHSPVSTIKSSQYKSEKRNMSYIKKFNSSSSRKGEKNRIPISNLFMSENSLEMSRSPSRLSLSSTFNGSCHTNDSNSLQYDDDSFIGFMSLEELKAKYNELYSKKMELQEVLNQKVTKALELSKEEFTMTCKVPLDHKLLDPLGEVYFTKNPLPSHLLNPENQSNYQSEKNRLLLQIETITNIYEVLRKTPKSEKKFKKELENKMKEIITIKKKLNSLETEHATEQGTFENCRSNSVGNINRISSILNETYIQKENSLTHQNNYLEVKSIYNVPLTEPSHRKFMPSEKFQIVNEEMHIGIETDSENNDSPIPRYLINTSKLKSNEYSISPNYSLSNASNFQRFHSARNIIKGPLLTKKVKNSFIKREKSNSLIDQTSSSISSTSRSSIDDVTSCDFPDVLNHPIIDVENSDSKNKVISLRHNSTINKRVQTCRDSMEINHDRFNFSDSKFSRRILTKSNIQKRQSTSLEDLREEESASNVRYLAKRDQKELTEPSFSSCKTKITYRPSIRDGNINNLIRSKQPSIILKQARNNSLDLI